MQRFPADAGAEAFVFELHGEVEVMQRGQKAGDTGLSEGRLTAFVDMSEGAAEGFVGRPDEFAGGGVNGSETEKAPGLCEGVFKGGASGLVKQTQGAEGGLGLLTGAVKRGGGETGSGGLNGVGLQENGGVAESAGILSGDGGVVGEREVAENEVPVLHFETEAEVQDSPELNPEQPAVLSGDLVEVDGES